MYRKILLTSGLTLFAAVAQAQTTHTVNVLDNSFSPAALTIQAGDTVQFVNAAGGNNHNAVTTSGPTSFECGTDGCITGGGDSGTGAQWTASIVLNDEGTINYLCEVHGQGMSGSITVGPVPVTLQKFDID